MAFNRPLQPGRVALMFALGSLTGVGGVFGGLFLVGSGPFALIVPALGFFIGGAMASVALHTGFLGMFSFGVAFVVGGVGSFLAVVATQAMTGRESPFFIIFVFLTYFVGAWGAAGLIALGLVFRRIGSYVFRLGLIGFSGGGVVGGLIVALTVLVLMATRGGNLILWVATTVGLVVPAAIGGGVVARALNSRSSGL